MEKTSEKLLQQVAIKKLNWHHNYGKISTNMIIIIISSWHIYLFWGFCIIKLTKLIRHPLNIGELLVSFGIDTAFC